VTWASAWEMKAQRMAVMIRRFIFAVFLHYKLKNKYFNDMKKTLLILLCLPWMLNASSGVITFGNLGGFLTVNESTAYHLGQIIGLATKILGSLGICYLILRKFSTSMSC
jgi:hypothetical protein